MSDPGDKQLIADLRAIITEEISQLRALLRADADALPPGLPRLSTIEGVIMRMLIKRPMVSEQAIYHALYSDRPAADQPGERLPSVFICLLRRKLKPAGIVIFNQKSVGWYLDDDVRISLGGPQGAQTNVAEAA
jgi:hypothetical protein